MDYKALLESWSNEFASRCNRVRHLIRDRHWLSDGRHKEEILADHLARYLPRKWSLASGFIISHDANISPEIDIHICDHERSPPLLADGSVRIVAAEAVGGFIEVKSTASTSSFGDAAAHQEAVLSVLAAVPRSIWAGAFFFTKGEINLERCLREHIGNLCDKQLLTPQRKLCFAIGDYGVVFVDGTISTAKIRLFPTATLGFPIAMCDLLAFIASSQETIDCISVDRIVGSVELDPPTIINL